MFKRKEKTQKAILIEKRVMQNNHEMNEVKKLYRMSYGLYNSLDENKKATLEFYLTFLTKKGQKTFKVPSNIYYIIKIDSFVDLVSKGTELRSFTVLRKANKEDLKQL